MLPSVNKNTWSLFTSSQISCAVLDDVSNHSPHRGKLPVPDSLQPLCHITDLVTLPDTCNLELDNNNIIEHELNVVVVAIELTYILMTTYILKFCKDCEQCTGNLYLTDICKNSTKALTAAFKFVCFSGHVHKNGTVEQMCYYRKVYTLIRLLLPNMKDA